GQREAAFLLTARFVTHDHHCLLNSSAANLRPPMLSKSVSSPQASRARPCIRRSYRHCRCKTLSPTNRLPGNQRRFAHQTERTRPRPKLCLSLGFPRLPELPQSVWGREQGAQLVANSRTLRAQAASAERPAFHSGSSSTLSSTRRFAGTGNRPSCSSGWPQIVSTSTFLPAA